MQRSVIYQAEVIDYYLERKRVKNINLRIQRGGEVKVSAPPALPLPVVDAFVQSKGAFILASRQRLAKLLAQPVQVRNYMDGESLYLQGQELKLKVVEQAKHLAKDRVYLAEGQLVLQFRGQADRGRRERLLQKFWNEQCQSLFTAILQQQLPLFPAYDLPQPVLLRWRKLKARWGSCLPQRGLITLSKQLLAAPRPCIEYVILHELCHFIQPNHSKQFYDLLTKLQPDWRARKALLLESARLG